MKDKMIEEIKKMDPFQLYEMLYAADISFLKLQIINEMEYLLDDENYNEYPKLTKEEKINVLYYAYGYYLKSDGLTEFQVTKAVIDKWFENDRSLENVSRLTILQEAAFI